MKVSDLFEIFSGNKLDFDKQIQDDEGINFVSRNSNFHGIVGKIVVKDDEIIYKPGDISVSLGGSYLLSCYIQEDYFVTGQNVNVLRPKKEMKKVEKLFYCYALTLNRFKFCAFGREVNKYLKDIELPDVIPDYVYENNLNAFKTNNEQNNIKLNINEWKYFKIKDIFKKVKVKKYSKIPDTIGEVPFISSQALNNGVKCYVDVEAIDGNCITVSTNGSGFDSFYHKNRIAISNDVEVLYSPYLNIYTGLFLSTILKLEKYRWAYGRKPKNNKVFNTIIRLPHKNGKPDWEYMEEYIKSLPNGDLFN